MGQPITETIGVDLGDKHSAWCVVDQASGEELGSGQVRTAPAAFEKCFAARASARTVLEVGTHSPRVSRIASASCAETYVANAREVRFIFKNQRNSDGADARALARVGRMDPELLTPILHRSEQAES